MNVSQEKKIKTPNRAGYSGALLYFQNGDPEAGRTL